MLLIVDILTRELIIVGERNGVFGDNSTRRATGFPERRFFVPKTRRLLTAVDQKIRKIVRAAFSLLLFICSFSSSKSFVHYRNT